ncbi:hypothetical protein Tco_0908633 [Tanacetum coccineum]|uniref:Uncharacterized protein n=1 Tax=Tanacetum coccineum TaxID=301880 RepID=A0ABQ5CNE6_9ASTR
MVPRAILMKSGLVSVNIARQVNAAHSKTTVNAARPMDKNVNTARLKVVVNAVKGNNVNVVKASAFWVWKPKTKVLDHVSKHNSALITLNKFDHIDAQGRSNLTMKEIDGGYVAFEGNPKGGKITGKRYKAIDNAGQARKETEPVKDYILLPLWTDDSPYSQDLKSSYDDGSKPSNDDGKKVDEDPRKESEYNDQEKEDNVNITNYVNVADTNEVNVVGGKTSIELLFDPNMPVLKDYSIFDFSRDNEDDGAEADMNNLDTTIQVSPIPTTIIHKDHPLEQVIGDLE